jgi:hypothetical protein
VPGLFFYILLDVLYDEVSWRVAKDIALVNNFILGEER